MSGVRGADLRWLVDLLSRGGRHTAESATALREARALCDQVKSDLSSAHDEICKLQGVDPTAHSWPAWTAQANTLRWIDGKIIPQIDASPRQDR
jgi:hypothetical protein